MEFLDEDNEQKHGCGNMTNGQAYTPIALSIFCSITFVSSMPGVVLGLYEYWIKNNISDLRTERLLLYMSCVGSVFSFAGSFQWIAKYQLSNNYSIVKHLCPMLGYVWLVTGIFLAVITFCIGIHFFIQMCQLKQLNVERGEKIRKYRKLEQLYLSSAVVISLVFSPWPFLDNSFGYNKWICWIDIRKNCSDQDTKVGFPLVTAFYLSITVTFIFTLCVVSAVQVLICLKKRSTQSLYIPVFLTYLLVSLLVIVVTLIVNFPANQTVPSIDWIQGMISVSIGIIPFTASLVTSVAVVYKVVYRYRQSSKLISMTKHVQYQAINNTDSINTDTLSRQHMTSSTHWESPGTEVITSSSTISGHTIKNY